MMKSVITVVVAFAVGAAGGAFLTYNHLAPKLAAASAAQGQRGEESKRLQGKEEQAAARLREEAQAAEARADQFKKQNYELLDKVAALEKQLAAPKSEGAVAAAVPAEVPAAPEAAPEAPAQPQPAPRAAAKPAIPPTPEFPGQWPSMTRTPEERQAARQRLVNSIQEGVAQYLENEIQRAPDTASRDRLVALGEGVQNVFTTKQQALAAGTDEERTAAYEAWSGACENVLRLVQEQRQAMLHQTAAQYGLVSPEQQTAFTNSVQDLLNNPFFTTTDDQILGYMDRDFRRFVGEDEAQAQQNDAQAATP